MRETLICCRNHEYYNHVTYIFFCQAITSCYAERIGHGLNMFDTSFFHPETPVNDKQKYVDGIIRFIANRRICVEVRTQLSYIVTRIASYSNHKTINDLMKN